MVPLDLGRPWGVRWGVSFPAPSGPPPVLGRRAPAPLLGRSREVSWPLWILAGRGGSGGGFVPGPFRPAAGACSRLPQFSIKFRQPPISDMPSFFRSCLGRGLGVGLADLVCLDLWVLGFRLDFVGAALRHPGMQDPRGQWGLPGSPVVASGKTDFIFHLGANDHNWLSNNYHLHKFRAQAFGMLCHGVLGRLVKKLGAVAPNDRRDGDEHDAWHVHRAKKDSNCGLILPVHVWL